MAQIAQLIDNLIEDIQKRKLWRTRIEAEVEKLRQAIHIQSKSLDEKALTIWRLQGERDRDDEN